MSFGATVILPNILSANKAVLAAASQKLSFLLAETGDDDVTIIIPESDFKTVEILLKYIYSGTFIVKNFTNDLEELIKDWVIIQIKNILYKFEHTYIF